MSPLVEPWSSVSDLTVPSSRVSLGSTSSGFSSGVGVGSGSYRHTNGQSRIQKSN